MQRCSAQTVDIVTKIDVRQIATKNFVFCKPPLKPEGDEHFARLAGEATFGRQKGKFGELLCNRAAALGNASAKGIRPCGAGEGTRIDAPM